MLPDFNRLRVFYFVFLNKSVAAAARSLHVTPSAVSQHLRKLEDELKIKLFTRLPKHLVPTPAGAKLFAILQPFVDHLESGLREIHDARRHPSGILRIGAPVEFGENTLPRIMAAFQRDYPQVRFHLELGHPAVLLPMVREGSIDLAFADIFVEDRYFSKELSLFSIEPVVEEALVLVCAAAYDAAKWTDRPSLNRLKNERYISYRSNAPAIRSWFKHHYKKAAIRLHVVLTVESVRGVVQAVKQNMGLGIVPAHVVQEELQSGELVKFRTGKKDLINRISLVQLQAKVPGAAEKKFVQFFKDSWT